MLPVAFTTQTPFFQVNAILCPSGDHVTDWAAMLDTRTARRPSALITQIPPTLGSLAVAQVLTASRRPSGDHATSLTNRALRQRGRMLPPSDCST